MLEAIDAGIACLEDYIIKQRSMSNYTRSDQAKSDKAQLYEVRALLASQPAKVDRTFDVQCITMAYESGFGHAHRSLPNPYHEGSDEYLAYDEGKRVGKERNTTKNCTDES